MPVGDQQHLSSRGGEISKADQQNLEIIPAHPLWDVPNLAPEIMQIWGLRQNLPHKKPEIQRLIPVVETQSPCI